MQDSRNGKIYNPVKINIKYFMIRLNKKNLWNFVYVSIIFFYSCGSNKSLGAVYNAQCYEDNIKTVYFWQFLQFQNKQLIKIEGIYKHGFEMNALFPSQNITTKKAAIWLDFSNSTNLVDRKNNRKLFGDANLWNDLYNKRIKVIGLLDLNENGHLEQYQGTISNICYLEVMP